MSYNTSTQKCPYCKDEMHADWVDNGVGMVQCGPYHCQNCNASEIGPEFYDWAHKTRDGEDLYLPGKKVYIEYLGRKVNLAEKLVLKPGHPFTEEELETGYYKEKISPYANTVDGNLVGHEKAKEAYDIGMLDEKDLNKPPL